VVGAWGMGENDVARLLDRIAEAIPLTGGAATVVNVLELNLALDAAANQDR
jgi:K+-transporting ATPase c subunit